MQRRERIYENAIRKTQFHSVDVEKREKKIGCFVKYLVENTLI